MHWFFLFKRVLHVGLEEKIDFQRAKKPRRLQVVLSRGEINELLAAVSHDLHSLMASLMYGAGLRLMECVRLRVFDIDFLWADCCSAGQGQQGPGRAIA